MPDADVHYPHLGERPGLGVRAARAWRRRNTYVLTIRETIAPEVLADPPLCFTSKEWPPYVLSLADGGWRMPATPFLVQHETTDERQSRQARSARAAACEDCLLFYQLDQRSKGRCHPPQFALTPVDRLMQSEHNVLEGRYVAAPGHGAGRSDVPLEAPLHDGEVR